MTRPGDQLGAYELVRPLGAGGMAETFVAVRRGPAGFEQRVCLKRILPGCAADPVFVELFLDEARLLARLQCRNIVHVHDFGEIDGTYYMALELIDGVDLEGLLTSLRGRGARMPESVALYITTEILTALSYAHTLEIDGELQQIVHRDISPSNILLSKTGEVKLTDFGIAKARGRAHRTQAGHTKGKIAYMSPEQMRAEELDGRSDLFAVGVVLFELLTGAHPFDATTDYALQVNIMTGKRRPLRELLPSASNQLATLVDALLATDRDQRPASAADAIALMPPLESTFALQRQLETLVKQRTGSGGVVAASGSDLRAHAEPSAAAGGPASASGPRSSLGQVQTPLASQPAGARSAVTARGTTAGSGAKRSQRPALWIALAALFLIGTGLAYALAHRAELAQTLAPTPSRAGSVADPHAPPNIPEAPGEPHAPNAPHAEPPVPAARVAPIPEGASEPELDPAGTGRQHEAHGSERAHGHHHGDRSRAHKTTEAEQDPTSGPAETVPNLAVPEPSSTPHAPALANPSGTSTMDNPGGPPSNAHVVLPAPRTPDERPAPTRAPYVTPSGRVVLPAPPL